MHPIYFQFHLMKTIGNQWYYLIFKVIIKISPFVSLFFYFHFFCFFLVSSIYYFLFLYSSFNIYFSYRLLIPISLHLFYIACLFPLPCTYKCCLQLLLISQYIHSHFLLHIPTRYASIINSTFYFWICHLPLSSQASTKVNDISYSGITWCFTC